MSDLARRSVLTVLAVLAVWAVHRLPLPGVQLPDFVPTWGMVGLTPILVASVLVSLVALLLPGIPRSRPAFELWTAGLAASLTMLMALQVVGELSSGLAGVGLAPESSAAVIAATCSGTVALALLAWFISARGVGNGLAIVFAVTAFEDLAAGLTAVRGDGGTREPLLPVLLLALGWGGLLVGWFRSSRFVPIQQAGDGAPERMVRVSQAAVGALAMNLAFGVGIWLDQVGMLAPLDSLGLDRLTPFGTGPVPAVLAFVVLAILAGWLWSTHVLDPHGPLGPGEARPAPGAAPRQAPTSPSLSGARLFRENRSFLIGAPIAAGFLLLALPALGAEGVAPLLFLPCIAVVLDTARQWNEHHDLAHAPGSPAAGTCGACGEPTDEGDPACGFCGVLFVDGISCASHGDQTAVSRCILCSRDLCALCTRASDLRQRCVAHRGAGVIGAWVTVEEPVTRAQAEAAADRLRARGIEARVQANSPTALYGSLGLYDLRDLVPLAVHPELLGGRNRVLVPTGRWCEAVGAGAESGDAATSGRDSAGGLRSMLTVPPGVPS